MVYHVGDRVRILEPLQVIRVGYPLTKEDALRAVEKEYAQQVSDFIVSITGKPVKLTNTDPRLCADLFEALALYWIRSRGFGGKERKIYTEANERFRDTSGWTVRSKRHVKTGTYCNGGYSGGYDGEPDYDPPHLSNEQTHTLLTIEPPDFNLSLTAIEIEAVNVEREQV
jgi:hypothetical protein